MKPLQSLFLAVSCVAALSSNASAAAFTGAYSFGNPGPGNVSTFAYNGAALPDLTASNLTKVGITSASVAQGFGGRAGVTGATDAANTFTGSVDLGKYVEFTLTAMAGSAFDLTSLSFGLSRQGTGARQFEWRSSADNFGSSMSNYSGLSAAQSAESDGVVTLGDIATGFPGFSIDLSGPTYQGLEAITFRFYAYNAEATSGIAGIQQNITFTGNTAAVPEPSTRALGAMAAVFALVIYRRRVAAVLA